MYSLVCTQQRMHRAACTVRIMTAAEGAVASRGIGCIGGRRLLPHLTQAHIPLNADRKLKEGVVGSVLTLIAPLVLVVCEEVSVVVVVERGAAAATHSCP